MHPSPSTRTQSIPPVPHPARVLARRARVLALGVGVLAACVGVLAVGVLSPPAAHAVTAPAPMTAVWAQEQTADPPSDPSADSTLPPGPRIEPEESEQATQDKVQNKAIIAAVAVGLLVIVVLGRKQRNKHRPGGRK